MSLTFATILCVDGAVQDSSVLYPNLSRPRPSQERRQIYWKTVNVFCATVRRCYPDARICVVTNDSDELNLNGVPVSQLLARLGVERCWLPFAQFKPPPGISRKFLNNFYRLDALQYLVNRAAHPEDGILLLDSDCVCAHPVAEIETIIPKTGVWCFTQLGERNPYLLNLDNLSRAQMGDTFRFLDASYPNPFPIWYGAEFIGGHPPTLEMLVSEMKQVWGLLLERAVQPLLYFANGESFFDNDEYLLSYVLSRGTLPTTSASDFCHRMSTLEGIRDITPGDEKYPIWHLASEKQRGLALLFAEVLDSNSLFWKSDVEKFHHYLGEYLGVPKRRYDLSYTRREQIERYARMGARWLRQKRRPALYSHSQAQV